jgi:hypothetical protein
MTKPRDLATLGGGFTQTGTGAIQRTVENKLTLERLEMVWLMTLPLFKQL